MQKFNVLCGKCTGMGYTNQRIAYTGDGLFKIEKDTCEECGGKGHTEYAIFSIEEAEAILKYCGLNKE